MIIDFCRSPKIDTIDAQIIEELSKNAKITCKELSQKVNLSVPRVFERTKKLEEKGIISGYHAAINLEAVGFGIQAFILLKTDKYVGSMREELSKMEYVQDVWVVAGEYHYLLRVSVPKIEDLKSIAGILYDRIGRTNTLLIMEH